MRFSLLRFRARGASIMQRFSHIAFGLGVGLAARLVLPGHPSIGWAAIGVFSALGSVVGEVTGKWLLPPDAIRHTGFASSAIGALTSLLAFAALLR